MPCIDSNNKPAFLDKSHSEPPSNKVAPSRFKMKKSLDFDKKVRSELAKELNTNLGSDKFNKAVEDIKQDIDEKIPEIFMDSIDERKKKSFGNPYKRYLEEKHELQKMTEGGISQEEIIERKTNEAKRNFLERLLGLNKD
ncbi:MAG: hypothetical protein EXS48_01530 [Candidatus Staskawiczbacteria bacterium]|nr:hypothetical protein [Candidatus Staskawiczbacteria bacterium]